jgi:hypothetical protein
MLSKLNMFWTTIIIGIFSLLTSLYIYHDRAKKIETLLELKCLKLKELVQHSHTLELERIKVDSYDSNSSSTNALLNQILEANKTNDSSSEQVVSTLADTTVREYLSKLLTFLHLPEFDLSLVLELIPLPVTVLQ